MMENDTENKYTNLFKNATAHVIKADGLDSFYLTYTFAMPNDEDEKEELYEDLLNIKQDFDKWKELPEHFQ